MTRLFRAFIFLFFLQVAPAWAQTPPNFDMKVFGLGPIIPQIVELDGDPGTIEWMTITLEGQFWVINPYTHCKELYIPKIFPVPGVYYNYFQSMFGRTHFFSVDVSPDDGTLPIYTEIVRSRCYPRSLQ